MRPVLLALLAALALGSASCTSLESNMPTMDDAAARQTVLDHADEVLALSGWGGFSTTATQPAPCQGPAGGDIDNAFTMTGTFQLIVPIEQQLDIVNRVSDGWAAAGFTVQPVTTFPSGGGLVTAVADDFVDMTLATGEPPAMVLIIVTACYRHP